LWKLISNGKIKKITPHILPNPKPRKLLLSPFFPFTRTLAPLLQFPSFSSPSPLPRENPLLLSLLFFLFLSLLPPFRLASLPKLIGRKTLKNHFLNQCRSSKFFHKNSSSTLKIHVSSDWSCQNQILSSKFLLKTPYVLRDKQPYLGLFITFSIPLIYSGLKCL